MGTLYLCLYVENYIFVAKMKAFVPQKHNNTYTCTKLNIQHAHGNRTQYSSTFHKRGFGSMWGYAFISKSLSEDKSFNSYLDRKEFLTLPSVVKLYTVRTLPPVNMASHSKTYYLKLVT